jgi:hypothetical protein
MWQRIDTSNGKRKVWIVLKSETEPMCLDTHPEKTSITVKRLPVGRNGQLCELVAVQDRIVRLAGLQALSDQLDRAAKLDDGDDLDGLRQKRPRYADAGAKVHSGCRCRGGPVTHDLSSRFLASTIRGPHARSRHAAVSTQESVRARPVGKAGSR